MEEYTYCTVLPYRWDKGLSYICDFEVKEGDYVIVPF